MTRIIVLLAVVVSLLVSCASSETVHAPVATVDSLVLEGARQEIENGTIYNPWLLWNYVTTDYSGGKRQASGVYPGGDIDPNEGVCTDLIVRSCRNAGLDLQQLVHEDVVSDLGAYGIKTPDKYIDHRRVWVLLRYFKRNYELLPTATGNKYLNWLPGDIVIWDVGSNHHMHIGIISDKHKKRTGRPFVIHNNRYFPGVFPGKTAEQDILLGPKLTGVTVRSWKVVGHFRLSRPLGTLTEQADSLGSAGRATTGSNRQDSIRVPISTPEAMSAE